MSTEISVLVGLVRWSGFIIFMIGIVLWFLPLAKKTKKLTKSEKEFSLMGFSLMGIGFFLLLIPVIDILNPEEPLNMKIAFILLFLMGISASLWFFRSSFRRYKRELEKEQEDSEEILDGPGKRDAK